MKQVHPDAADGSNADSGTAACSSQWLLCSDANDLRVYCIRNFSGYIKMKERSERVAYDV